jgi:hypothetical protein
LARSWELGEDAHSRGGQGGGGGSLVNRKRAPLAQHRNACHGQIEPIEIGHTGLAQCPHDAAPVGIPTVDGRLHQAAAHHGTGGRTGAVAVGAVFPVLLMDSPGLERMYIHISA